MITGNTVFLSGAAATPIHVAKVMTDYGKKAGLKNVTVCHMHTEGHAPYTNPDCVGMFYVVLHFDIFSHSVYSQPLINYFVLT